jgi:hypothetical protein
MDAAAACALLNATGFSISPDTVRVEPREDRWAAWLPDGRMAWFPMNRAGARRLVTERKVLDLLAAQCTFRVPRVLHAASAGWQIREAVPGLCDPWGLYSRIRADPALARSIGRALGDILAEQHGRLRPTDAAGWLPSRPPWPEPVERVWDSLSQTIGDAGLLRTIECVLMSYEEQATGAADDCVLVHGDLGLHNLAVLPDTDAVAGVFDYDGASWADRHQDFRYLVFPDGVVEDKMLTAALDVYEPTLGLRLDRDRIRLCNAACAIGFLAHRAGTSPEARPCGRTLAEDLAWVGDAVRGLART